MIQRHGWHLLFHECIITQLQRLENAVSRSKIIIFAWVNDERTLRASGSKTDPYTVFQKMLESGHPPDNWSALLAAGKAEWKSKQ